MAIEQAEYINIRETRQNITLFIQDGVLDDRVINVLVRQNACIPKECEVWDYKLEVGKDATSLAETILQIVSFYNSYGGYLIYGVDETIDDIKFVPVGISEGILNVQQLRQLLTNYTGDEIDITYREVEYHIIGKSLLFGLMHIPKRPKAKGPIFFVKNGPQKANGDLVFQKDVAYMRSQDKCVPVKASNDFQLLLSERINPFLWDIDSPTNAVATKTIIVDHNLPDRYFICPKFIGRDVAIQELWQWLADELSMVKVLAGEGGKGKTSIAYEFAEQVCRTKPCGIEKVIWVTAKSKQFIGELDQYVRVPQTNFFDLESLLIAICSELAILDKEMEGVSIQTLKKLIKTAVNNITCLIVIDDIDSTDLDQQKMIMETAMQFPGSKARFLLTTRMNISYSSAACITIGGFNKEDYHIFLNDVIDRFKCAQLTNKQIGHMRELTEGSPLFTESLFRLHRKGMQIGKAMQEWKGKLGSEVRKAALLREIEALTLESRRVLLACSYMGEASLTEIKQVTGYSDQRMQYCISELTSMFLLFTKPFIKKEPRFTVSNNTARLILEDTGILMPDSTTLRNNVMKLRKGPVSSMLGKPYLHPVGAAITQAVALIRESKYDDAIATVESALQNHINNPGLLLTRSRCLFEKFNSSGDLKYLAMARRAFNKAYDYGQRKELLFNMWFNSEMLAKHPAGAIDVATLVIENNIPIPVEWLQRRADAYLNQSQAFRRTLNTDLALDHMKNAAKDIGKALSLAKDLQKPPLLEKLYGINDVLWSLADSVFYELGGISSSKGSFDTAEFLIGLGDNRRINFERLYHAIDEIYKPVAKSKKMTTGQMNVLEEMLRKSRNLLNKLQRIEKKDELPGALIKKQQELEEAMNRLKASSTSN